MSLFDTAWYINFGNGSSTGYYAVSTWTALTSYSAGQFVRQLATPAVNSERCFVCVIAGTTLASEPSWTLTRGALTAESAGPTWQECTGMAGTCGDLTNAPTWVASRVLTLGSMIYDSVSGSIQTLTTAGTSKSGAAPTFSATAGVTTTDNTCIWTSLGPTSNFTATPWKYPHARRANAFASTWGAGGNTFFVSNNHAETQATALTNNPPTGTLTQVNTTWCVVDTAAPPTTLANTATITTTSTATMLLEQSFCLSYIYGINFSCGSGSSGTTALTVGGTNPFFGIAGTEFENCSFSLAGNTSAGSTIQVISFDVNFLKLVNCAFTFGNAGQKIGGSPIGGTFIGGSIGLTGVAPSTLFASLSGFQYTFLLLKGVDLSGITGNLFNFSAIGAANTIVDNCLLHPGVVISSSPPTRNQNGPYIKVYNSDSAATNYRYNHITTGATVQQETTVVRTGGATDGTTPISLNISTTANVMFLYPFISEEISGWNDIAGVSETITMYLTTNTTLTNGDIWLEIEYQSSSASPISSTVSTRVAYLAATAPLTTDSSTWGGAITNKYSLSVAFTPQMKGVIKARIYVAKPSVTIYVDPNMYNSSGVSISRSYMIPGWGYINETSAGAGASMLVHPGLTGGARS